MGLCFQEKSDARGAISVADCGLSWRGTHLSIGNLETVESDAIRRIRYHPSMTRWWNRPIPRGRRLALRGSLDIIVLVLAGLIGAGVLRLAVTWFVVIFVCSVLVALLIRVTRKDGDLQLRDWRGRK